MTKMHNSKWNRLEFARLPARSQIIIKQNHHTGLLPPCMPTHDNIGIITYFGMHAYNLPISIKPTTNIKYVVLMVAVYIINSQKPTWPASQKKKTFPAFYLQWEMQSTHINFNHHHHPHHSFQSIKLLSLF